jgi:hypothetical protein
VNLLSNNEPYGATLVLRTAFFWVVMQVVAMDPEESSSQLLRCGSMKSYTLLDFDIIHSIIDAEVLKPK